MNLTSFAVRVLLVAGVILGLYGLGWALGNIGGVVWMLGIAALAAYLINPLVLRLENRGMGRNMAIGAVFLGLLSLVVVTAYLLVPVAKRQGGQVMGQVQDFAGSGIEYLGQLQVLAQERLPAGVLEGVDLQAEAETRITAFSGGIMRGLTAFAVGVAANFVFVFITPMITFLLLLDGPTFQRRLVQGVPNAYFERVHRLIRRIDGQLGSYMRGVLLVAAGVGSVATFGLWLCGLKYFFVVGPFMGLLNVIPIFGPLVGTGLAVLAMLLQSGDLGAVVGPLIVGISAQVLDNVAFTPIAVSRSVDLHPIAVLVSTLVGGELFGLVGLLLAVPLLATMKVLFEAVQEVRHRSVVVPLREEVPH